MSSVLTDKIAEMIEPTIEGLGFELVRVQLFSSPRGEASTLQVMAEKEDGTMTVEGCAKISREISTLLDVGDTIDSEYVLEVSSPGLDRPLTRKKDFVNYAGFEAKIELIKAVENRKRYRGILLGVENDLILIKVDGEKYQFDFSDVLKAKLVMTDELVERSAVNPS